MQIEKKEISYLGQKNTISHTFVTNIQKLIKLSVKLFFWTNNYQRCLWSKIKRPFKLNEFLFTSVDKIKKDVMNGDQPREFYKLQCLKDK